MKKFGSAAIAAVAIGVAAALATVPGASEASPSSSTSDCSVSDYTMGLRYQQSASVAALQRQSYAVAGDRLTDVVGPMKRYRKGVKRGLIRQNRHLAIVADLDETVLDNTDLLGRDLQACHDYTTWDTWSDWEINGHPRLIPGAAKFFADANRTGVSIYYISDRYQENKASTMATLKELGLPQVKDDHVLLYGPSKAERRALVAQRHRIFMLLGDSLPDLDAGFKGATAAQQQALVDQNAAKWGRRWITFPNASYGQWSTNPVRAWDKPLTTP